MPEFNEKDWRARVKQATTSEELRQLARELPPGAHDPSAFPRPTPAPTFVVERRPGSNNEPVFRVSFVAPQYGENGELHTDYPDHISALAAARRASLCAGWPVEDRAGATES